MSSPVPPELQQKISLWRQRAAEGTLTRPEMLEAVRALREGRANAQAASDSSVRKRAVAAIPHADDLLKELGM